CSCPVPLALSPAACLLCRRTEADPDICGDKQEKHGLCAHIFCLVSCTGPPSGIAEGTVGLPGEALRLLLMGLLGSFQHCCVCGETGATIMCCQEDCDRWFHLPCAKEGPSISHFARPFSPSSYCPEHCPEQDVRAIPEPGTECPICMEPVEERKSYTTLVCPACKKAWFHRDCIQVGGQALRAGALYFQCPLCRDDDEFAVQMFVMGIRIPFRLVSFCLAHNTGGGSCCARPCPRSPGPALSRESGLQLHARLEKAPEEEQGQPVPPGWQSSTNSSAFPFPIRQPTWEDNNAFAELGERHSWCNARKCLYPGGREEAEEEG
uniref:Uncharacterized protein n=1 Tax=Corvus moneduloides TaxID=1196302 RepID=A0A8U7M167_CORMO